MMYKLKYKTRGHIESYIAMTTSFISELAGETFAEHELLSVLQNVTEEVMCQADLSSKGLSATPKWKISDGADKLLQVYNTNGREVLIVYFDRINDKCRGDYEQL